MGMDSWWGSTDLEEVESLDTSDEGDLCGAASLMANSSERYSSPSERVSKV